MTIEELNVKVKLIARITVANAGILGSHAGMIASLAERTLALSATQEEAKQLLAQINELRSIADEMQSEVEQMRQALQSDKWV